MGSQPHMRNLGHDLSGTKACRKVVKARLKNVRPRLRRAARLRRADGGRAACLWQTGLLPDAAHGAAVSGVAPSELA
eukprot:1708585-Pyramimonas_sp.AAC.1